MKFVKRIIVIGIAVFMVLGVGIGVLYLNQNLQNEDVPRGNALSGEEISNVMLEESRNLVASSEALKESESSVEKESAASPSKESESGAEKESAASTSKESESSAEKESAVSPSKESESSAEKESAASTSKESESSAEKESAASTSKESESSSEKESAAGNSQEASGQGGNQPAESAGQNGTQDQLVDKQAPVFLAFTASPQIKVGNKFDVHKYCGYADDVDRHVDMEVTGTVDTSKEGTYPITIKLTDDTGRVTKKDMSVHVVSKTGSSGGSGKKENFSDFVKNYKTEETSVGIDISRWQETVDFEKIKAAGCEFVYMRLGGYDNGELYTDRYYLQNMAGAKAAGLKVGIYWHSEESSRAEMKTSIDYLMKVLDGQQLDFPIAFDWEDFMNFEDHGMNLYDINDLLDGFAEEIEARGYKACLYGSKNKLETLWNLYKKKLPIWLAHYTGSTNYGGDYFMWQHSCTGRIDGINGDVDLDVLYNGKANFQ